MTSTYSSSLRLELMATGDQSGTWGDTTNTNLGTLLEQAITGYLSVAQGDVANLTLTTTNGASDQARNAIVNVTGALTANRNVVVQTANKLYLMKNSTTGGFSIVAKTAAGTGVTIPPGTNRWVYSDGTNVVDGGNNLQTLTTTSLSPATTDGLALGTTALMWSDLFLASGGVINWNNGDVTVTHSANTLAFAGASSGYSFDALVSVTTTAAGAAQTLTSTDAGATAGPILDLYRNSASPAASDVIGRVQFNGQNSTPAKVEYGAIEGVIADATAASEDASMDFYSVTAGTRTKWLTALGSLVTFLANTSVQKANPKIIGNKAASTQDVQVAGLTAGLNRWAISLGDTTAESGSDNGSDFAIFSFIDAGSFNDTVMKIIRKAAGAIQFFRPFGYGAGVGGTVTQSTNKSTGVTLSKVSGQITLNNAALAASTTVSFTLTNTFIAATDVLIMNHVSGGTAGSYTLNAQCAAGSASINVRNVSLGSLSEAIVIQFSLIKGQTS